MIEVRLNPDVKPAGSDLSIVNAARRSFNTRSNWEEPFEDCDVSLLRLKEKDKRLLQFLARGMTADDFDKFVGNLQVDGASTVESDWVYPDETQDFIKQLWQWRNTPTHDTPFNHTFISFEVKAPIFVRAQLVKHEYLIMSEFSRRYITDDIEFYTPDKWRKAAENKKQGSSDEDAGISKETGINGSTIHRSEKEAIEVYIGMVENGVAPEQARMVLPQSTMTEWTWSGTLGAFAKMCQLRIHPEAQYEARLVAHQVYTYLKEYYPVAAKALVEGADV